MATTNVTVQDTIATPGAGTATGGTIRFELSATDYDLTDNETVYPFTETAVISGTGWMSAQLWPNDRGSKATKYRVYHAGETAAGAFDALLGTISVPSAGAPHNLSDLLAAGSPTVNAVYMGVITQAQYEAAIAIVQVTLVVHTADHTLADGDERKAHGFNSASDLVLTVPADATHDFPVGTQVSVLRMGTGAVTVAGAGGVTVNSAYGLSLPAQWAAGTLFKRAVDEWVFIG